MTKTQKEKSPASTGLWKKIEPTIKTIHGLNSNLTQHSIKVDCPDCDGSGHCLECDGYGCSNCDGHGNCLECDGMGSIRAFPLESQAHLYQFLTGNPAIVVEVKNGLDKLQ